MDQSLNREINLTLNEDVSGKLRAIAGAWGTVEDQIADVTDQLATLEARMAEFREVATKTGTAYQDMANRNQFATGVANQTKEQIAYLKEEKTALDALSLSLQRFHNEQFAQATGGLQNLQAGMSGVGQFTPQEANQSAIAAMNEIAAVSEKTGIAVKGVGTNFEIMQANADAAVQRLLREITQLYDRLELLRKQNVRVRMDSNSEEMLRQIMELHVQVQELVGKPYDIEFKTNLAEMRSQFAAQQNAFTEEFGERAGEKTGQRFSTSFGHALQVSFLYGAAFQILSSIQQGITDVIGQAVEQPVKAESAITTYARELGNAADARKRFAEAQQESQKVGLKDEDVLKIDQRLAQLGVTSETAQARFGRSKDQILRDLEDLASVPGLDASKVIEFFTRSSDGANRLILALKSAGVATTGELQQLGVVFNKQGTQILSDSNTTTTALLNLIEQKFGGLAEAQGKTLEGMSERTKNTWDRILQIIGQPSVEVISLRMQKAVDGISDPKNLKGIEDFGRRMAESLYAIGIGWDIVSEKAGEVIQKFQQAAGIVGEAVKNLTGMDIGSAIDQSGIFGPNEQQRKTLDDLIAGEQQAADAAAHYGQTANIAFGDAAAATEVDRVAVEKLNDALDEAKFKMDSVSGAFQDAMQPLKDQMDALRDTAKDRADMFDDIIKPLQAQKADLQDEARASAEANQTQIDALQEKLQGLQGAAEGIRARYEAAIAPLQEQERQLDRVYQRQQDINNLNKIDRDIARDKALSVDIYSQEGRAAALRLPGEMDQRSDLTEKMQHEDAKNALDDRIRSLQQAQQAEERAVQATEQAYQRRIANLEQVNKREQAVYTAAETALDKRIKKIQDAKSAESEYFSQLENNLQRQIDSLDKAYQRVQRGAQDVERAAQERIHQLENVQTVVAKTGINVLSFIDQVVQKIVGTAAIFKAYQQIPTGNRDYTQPMAGRAGGGGVDEGWYLVGERGPEMLHAGGPGYVAPNLDGSGSTVTLKLIGMDSFGNEMFRQLVRVNRGFIDEQVAISIKDNRK